MEMFDLIVMMVVRLVLMVIVIVLCDYNFTDGDDDDAGLKR